METRKMLGKQFHCGLRIADCGLKTPNSELRTLNSQGFTLIEMVLTLVIIGILAVTVMPKINFSLPGAASVDGAAYMVASDIRYAQEYAMANRVSKEIRFTSGSESYSFSPTSGLDPSGQLQGATIGTTRTITFNSLGEPISIPVGTASVTISISGIGGTKTITVSNYTGKVDISS